MVKVCVNDTAINHITLEFIDQVKQDVILIRTRSRFRSNCALVVLDGRVHNTLRQNALVDFSLQTRLQISDLSII